MLALKVLGAGQHVGRSASILHLDNFNILLDSGIQVVCEDPFNRFPDLTSLFEPLNTLNHDKRPTSLKHRNTCPWKNENYSQYDLGVNESHQNIHQEIVLPLYPVDQYKCIIDIVLITHSHLDHVGALPYLTEVLGYNGPILMTKTTLEQSRLQLEDCWLDVGYKKPNKKLQFCRESLNQSTDISNSSMDNNTNLISSKAYKKPHPFSHINISSQMIQRCLEKVITLPLNGIIELQSLSIEALPAGHIPGACMFFIMGNVSKHSVLYTGDFTCNGEQLLIPAKKTRIHPTLLISESTYGSQVRDSKTSVESEICSVVENTVRSGGKVLIPMSGIGKVQELAILLYRHWKNYGLQVPIVISQGLMKHGFDILMNYWKDWTLEQPNPNFILFMDAKTVLSTYSDKPVVFMCPPRTLSSGTSLAVFKAWANYPQNLICLVGFSVPGTVAFKIIRGSKVISLPTFPSQSNDVMGNNISSTVADTTSNYTIHAKIRYFSIASHVDSIEIQNFIRYCSPLTTVLIHGESTGMHILADRLRQILHRPVYTPCNNEVIISDYLIPPKIIQNVHFYFSQFLQSTYSKSLTMPYNHPDTFKSLNQSNILSSDHSLDTNRTTSTNVSASASATCTSVSDCLEMNTIKLNNWLLSRWKKYSHVLHSSFYTCIANYHKSHGLHNDYANQDVSPDLTKLLLKRVPCIVNFDTLKEKFITDYKHSDVVQDYTSQHASLCLPFSPYYFPKITSTDFTNCINISNDLLETSLTENKMNPQNINRNTQEKKKKCTRKRQRESVTTKISKQKKMIPNAYTTCVLPETKIVDNTLEDGEIIFVNDR